MSDFTLIDILNLVRAEIARTEIGDVKRITGPQGPQGPQGEAGIQGAQGPRGNDGKQGPAGSKGAQGKKGDKGVKGNDGSDGVGIARIDSEIDNAFTVVLTDGTTYEIEMPLVTSGNPTEVHYKVSGGGSGGGDGGSGSIDLSNYVKRPSGSLKDSWLVYKEGSDGSKTWAPVTTDLVAVNPDSFRNDKGQFIGTPEELEALKNQRDVNEFLYKAINDIEQGDINLDGYATEEWVEGQISGVVSKTGGDDMEGPLVINAQDSTDGRATNRVQTLGVYSQSESSALRLGTTRDRVYIGHDDTSFNGPIKVEEIQSKTEGEGIPLADEGTKDDHLITKGYVDGGDRQLQAEVDQIALALETLLVQREHGQWVYIGFSGDNIPRNAGEFSLISDDLSANENIITLNQEDLKGITHGFGDVEVGDYVEIVDLNDPANYVLFVVTKAPEGTGISNVEVSLKDKGQNILIGETCEIRFFAVNEQDIALEDLDNRYVNKTGDTMTGTLTVPRFEAKDFDGEGVCLIAGKATGTASASRLTFSNTGYQNAYGSIEWHGQNASGWFQINKDVDFGTKGLHSVNNIRLVGNKAIQEAQTTRIKFDGKVVIQRTGDNKDGFVIKGRDDSNLLSVYHNSSDLDSVNYTGKTGGSTNLATCGYVNSMLGDSKGALVNHMERLWKKGNGTDGKTFYFQNQNGSPSSSMNDFRKFKWKLPNSHYLMSMVSAGRDMGYIVVTNTSGSLQYQCQVTNSEKSGNYITLELDYENRYGSNMMGDDSYYIVHLFSFLREA